MVRKSEEKDTGRSGIRTVEMASDNHQFLVSFTGDGPFSKNNCFCNLALLC
jgi:hypothetical protein